MICKENPELLRLNNVIVIDNFLTPAACNKILFLMDNGFWVQSKIVMKDKQQQYVDVISRARTSSVLPDYSFTQQLKKKVQDIQNRVINIFKLKEKNLENWQIIKYGLNDQFDFHLDCGLGHDIDGDQEKTILLYLHTPVKGGETFFRALNLYVRPLQGRLVVWDNLLSNGDCNHAMIHAGLPVKQGIKITLNTWYRQHHFLHKT